MTISPSGHLTNGIYHSINLLSFVCSGGPNPSQFEVVPDQIETWGPGAGS